jgi:hypothetical protein
MDDEVNQIASDEVGTALAHLEQLRSASLALTQEHASDYRSNDDISEISLNAFPTDSPRSIAC